MPVSPALEMWKQEDQKFRFILDCTANLRLTWATWACLKKQNQNNNNHNTFSDKSHWNVFCISYDINLDETTTTWRRRNHTKIQIKPINNEVHPIFSCVEMPFTSVGVGILLYILFYFLKNIAEEWVGGWKYRVFRTSLIIKSNNVATIIEKVS